MRIYSLIYHFDQSSEIYLTILEKPASDEPSPFSHRPSITLFLTNFSNPKSLKSYLTWPCMANTSRLLFRMIQNNSE